MGKIEDNNFSCRVYNLVVSRRVLEELDLDIDLYEKLLYQKENEPSIDKIEIVLDKLFKKQINKFKETFEKEFDNKIEITVIGLKIPRIYKDYKDAFRFDLAFYGIMSEDIITTENIVSNVAGILAQETFDNQQNFDMFAECKIKR